MIWDDRIITNCMWQSSHRTLLSLHFTSPSCVSLCSSFISSCPLYCTSRLVILLLLPLNSTALPFHIIVVYFILSIPSLFAPLFRPTSPIPSVSPSWLSIPLLFYSTISFYSLFILPCCLTSPLSLSFYFSVLFILLSPSSLNPPYRPHSFFNH